MAILEVELNKLLGEVYDNSRPGGTFAIVCWFLNCLAVADVFNRY